MADDPSIAEKRSVRHRTVTVEDLDIFYREAGPAGAPTLLLLHGYPSSSQQYTGLIDRLSDRFHLVAPDYPGFGYSSAPESNNETGTFVYTFDRLAEVTEAFLTTIGVTSFFMYVFDFGAPVGYRIATSHPDWIRGVIAQNGNAYEAGLGPGMRPAMQFWKDRSGLEGMMRGAVSADAIRAQHLGGAKTPELINPDAWTLDQYWLHEPGRIQIMLDLIYDYQSNVRLYPVWQAWLREHRPPVLLPWGKNDELFTEAGARAYLADVPDAQLHLLDTGHFALDDHLDAIADLVAEFVSAHAD